MEAIVSGPGEGERLESEHREMLVKGARPELDFLEYDVGPGYEGPGPHYHEAHVDSFYVLEGELEFRVGDDTVRAPAGTSILVPPGLVHAFTNPGPGRARFLNVHAPERGFVAYQKALARGEDVDPRAFDVHDV